MDCDSHCDVSVKDEITDESVLNEDDLNDLKCQDETEILQDSSTFIQVISPIIKIEDPNRNVGGDGDLDLFEDVKSNSWVEGKELSYMEDNDEDEIAADEDDIEHDQPSTSTDVAVNNKCGKSYTCQVCWITFKSPSNLKIHQVTHTGERNFHWG